MENRNDIILKLPKAALLEQTAEEAAELKRLLKLMRKKDISVEDLESMISKED